MCSVDTGPVALEGHLQQRRRDYKQVQSGSMPVQATTHLSLSPTSHRVFVAIDSW